MKPLEDLTRVERTKRLFKASFELLYPSLRRHDADQAWRDLRTVMELEHISDMAIAMGRAAAVAKHVAENRHAGVRG